MELWSAEICALMYTHEMKIHTSVNPLTSLDESLNLKLKHPDFETTNTFQHPMNIVQGCRWHKFNKCFIITS